MNIPLYYFIMLFVSLEDKKTLYFKTVASCLRYISKLTGLYTQDGALSLSLCSSSLVNVCHCYMFHSYAELFH